jgi:hypothetical protein
MKTQRIWQDDKKTYLHQQVTPETELATGVLDSAGREIYEGDILLQHMTMEMEKSGRKPNLGYVYYERGSFFILGGGPLWEYLYEDDPQIAEYRIIGNLKENPELGAWV